MNTLGEYMPGMDSTASGQDKDFDLMQSGGQPTKAERQETDAIRSSAEAYRTLNTTLGGFYEQPQQGESSEDRRIPRLSKSSEHGNQETASGSMFQNRCNTLDFEL